MDAIFYGELKNAIAAITEFDKVNAPEVINGMRQKLVMSVAGITELSSIARKEGLLQMEFVMENMAEEAEERVPHQDCLQQMIELVTDGTDLELIREICMLKFAVRQYAGYDALIFLIYLNGMLCVQAGENPLVVQKKLRGMLPEAADAVYEERKPERIFMAESKEAEVPEDLVRRYSEADSKPEGMDEQEIARGEQFELRILELLVKEMQDDSVQQLLQDVDNTELAIAMIGMDGEVRGIIFQNMTSRRADAIALDLYCMGPVRLKDVRESARHIIELIFRMESCGQIYLKENGFARIFMYLLQENDKELEQMKQLRNRSTDLEKLFEEYRKYCKKTFGRDMLS